jgi:hypothetical protein
MGVAVGYSGTPLPKKLGLKDGQRLLLINGPKLEVDLARSRSFLQVDQTEWQNVSDMRGGYDVIHGFTLSANELKTHLVGLQSQIVPDGMIWISWPKKASKVETNVTEDVVRAEALTLDLVDVKVCAIDAVWSGLKLVIRKEKRHLYGLEIGSSS